MMKFASLSFDFTILSETCYGSFSEDLKFQNSEHEVLQVGLKKFREQKFQLLRSLVINGEPKTRRVYKEDPDEEEEISASWLLKAPF
jgi:hypothetical protein